jgi:hypothetical protein
VYVVDTDLPYVESVCEILNRFNIEQDDRFNVLMNYKDDSMHLKINLVNELPSSSSIIALNILRMNIDELDYRNGLLPEENRNYIEIFFGLDDLRALKLEGLNQDLAVGYANEVGFLFNSLTLSAVSFYLLLLFNSLTLSAVSFYLLLLFNSLTLSALSFYLLLLFNSLTLSALSFYLLLLFNSLTLSALSFYLLLLFNSLTLSGSLSFYLLLLFNSLTLSALSFYLLLLFNSLTLSALSFYLLLLSLFHLICSFSLTCALSY